MTIEHDVRAGRVDDALAEVLAPGQDIVVGQGFGSPTAVLEALPRHLAALQGSRLLVGWVLGGFPDLPGVEIATFFPSGPFGTRDGLAAAGARYERSSLYGLARDLRSGARRVDVAIAQAAPPSAGRYSLGWTVDYIAAAAERADAVVLEVDAHVPRTGPRSLVPPDAHVVAVPVPPSALAPPAGPAVAGPLGANVAAWVPDGATLELGLGRWVGEVVAALAARRGLHIHTGLVGEWTLELLARGALDPATPIVATAAVSSAPLAEALATTSSIALAPAYETHDPGVLAALPAFRAVNSVLEVDLTGRANTEVGTGGRLGGVGGLPDFAAGAAANPDGLSIIALTATAGARSRIVARLPEDRVSLPAEHVDVVVTEHGSADLRGVPPQDRAPLLIRVAAPEHRAALADAVRRRGNPLHGGATP